MISSSSHSAYTRGTGTAVCASARITRYSRSTAWALGSRWPRAYAVAHTPSISDKLVSWVGLAALKSLGSERATEPADMIVHPAFEPTEGQIIPLPPDCCPTRGNPPAADSHLVPHKPALPTVDCIWAPGKPPLDRCRAGPRVAIIETAVAKSSLPSPWQRGEALL